MPSDRRDKQQDSGGAVHRADSQQAHVRRVERLRSGDDSSLMGVKVHKVCCVCGMLLNHRPRFKDSKGRYWCAACNDADHEKIRPMPCADCGTETPRAQLKEVGGVLLCPVCIGKCVSESKTVAQVRLQALAHSQQATARPSGWGRTVPWGKVVLAVVMLLAAIIIMLLLTR